MRLIRRFIEDRSGATAIEYACIAGLISIVIVLSVTSIGTKLNAKFMGPVSNGLS